MTDTKRCSRCGEVKSRSEFHKRRASPDGLQADCKACCKVKFSAYRDANREKEKAKARAYYAANQDEIRAKRRAALCTRSGRIKAHARYRVNQAIAKGELTRQPCERCGATEQIDAHHEDYSKPLDVVWLCRSCHVQRHVELAEQERADA